MTREELIERITAEVMKSLSASQLSQSMPQSETKPVFNESKPFINAYEKAETVQAPIVKTYSAEVSRPSQDVKDLTQAEYKDTIQLDAPENALALRAMERTTNARIGIGRNGERLSAKALLSLRADHAMAKDAVLKAVDEKLLSELGLPVIQSKCSDIDTHLTRPDLGRQLSEEAKNFLHTKCEKNPQIQIYVSDGLSSYAIENNIKDVLSILTDGLKADGIKLGTPFFVKYGRVPTMDAVSEEVGAELTCVLIGERPGLAASDSMSAYITYGAYVGIPESKRTVVSNIHKNGTQPVEAGAYLVELLQRILKEKKSGVDLQM